MPRFTIAALAAALIGCAGVAHAQTNLVPNPDFTNGIEFWGYHPAPVGHSFNTTQSIGHSAPGSVWFAGTGGQDDYIAVFFPTTPGAQYEITFWLLNIGSGGDHFFCDWDGVRVFNQAPLTFPAGNLTGPWNQVRIVVTATTGSTNLALGGYDASQFIFLDDVAVQELDPPGMCCRGVTCSVNLTRLNCTTSSVAGGAAGVKFIPSVNPICNIDNAIGPCCYSDYNKNSTLSVQDIFDFLNDWFLGSPFTRTTPGNPSVQDVFTFLNNWFAGGCP